MSAPHLGWQWSGVSTGTPDSSPMLVETPGTCPWFWSWILLASRTTLCESWGLNVLGSQWVIHCPCREQRFKLL
ncbi:hypothetical protein L2E82_47923 [Cichorium intybus]|uniref:Uncharacterized protein n=1 Tax=Cichorium intybus TaxID=13427 RepID=A0ACB8YXD7_CICIN|nr:hypothetical protein L2E82_47923 [Cichorium intybus]